MNDACGLRCFGADRNRPRLDLHLARREERLQTKQLVRGLRQARQTRFLEAQVGEELRLLVIVELGELCFDLRADRQRLDAVDFFEICRDLVFVDIREVHDRLHGKQVQVVQQLALLVGHLHEARRIALVEPVAHALGDLVLGHVDLVAFGVLLQARQRVLERRKIRQDKLGANRLDVGDGVVAALVADDVRIAEVADNLADSIGLANVRQELVAQPLAFARALDKAGDVDEFDSGRDNTARMDDLCEFAQALIGDRHDADVGVDGCERIVCCKTCLVRQCSEQSRLADVRQADNANGKRHTSLLLFRNEIFATRNEQRGASRLPRHRA